MAIHTSVKKSPNERNEAFTRNVLMFMPFLFAVIVVGALHFLFERSNLVLLQWLFQRLERHIKWCRLYCRRRRRHAIYSMCMKCYVRLTTTITAITAEAAFHENLKKYLQVLITR